MTAVPKPLKFLAPHYETLVKQYEVRYMEIVCLRVSVLEASFGVFVVFPVEYFYATARCVL